MAKLLKNLKVTEVSILTGDKLPANGESVIVKNAGSFEIVAKADKCIDGLVYCTVIKANTPDSDGEETEPETIQKAAHDFLKNSRTIDENHNHSALDGVAVVQSYIADNGDWKAVFDVSENAVMLEKAKKGEITGVSIYGAAQKVEKAGAEISARNKSVLRQAYDLLSGFFHNENQETEIEIETKKNKQEGEEMPTKDELRAMLAEIAKEDAANAESLAKAQKQAELETSVKTLTETVEKQAKTIEELAKGRKTDSELTGEITQEMIFKCEDPAKAAEMTRIFKSQKKG